LLRRACWHCRRSTSRLLTTSGWIHGGTGRSGLPDSHELQGWAAGTSLVGVTPVPLVIAGLLAVLAVACIVGGAWGGEVLIGRQESRRYQRERDRESQTFWRGQRLTVYATALDTFEHLADRLTADAGLGDPPTPARADRISTDALARIKRDLDTIGLIGSQHTVVLTNQIVADFDILAARMRHQARCGDEPMKDLNDELATLRNRIWELRAQFRTDLAIPP
jgi:hypothetical protein